MKTIYSLCLSAADACYNASRTGLGGQPLARAAQTLMISAAQAELAEHYDAAQKFCDDGRAVAEAAFTLAHTVSAAHCREEKVAAAIAALNAVTTAQEAFVARRERARVDREEVSRGLRNSAIDAARLSRW